MPMHHKVKSQNVSRGWLRYLLKCSKDGYESIFGLEHSCRACSLCQLPYSFLNKISGEGKKRRENIEHSQGLAQSPKQLSLASIIRKFSVIDVYLVPSKLLGGIAPG